MLGHKEEVKSTATRILPGAPQERVCCDETLHSLMGFEEEGEGHVAGS